MTNKTSQSGKPQTELSTAKKNELDSRFNELQAKILDDRGKYINRWLTVVAIVLTFFGLVVVVGGYISFDRIREIEFETKTNLEQIETLVHRYENRIGSIDAEFAKSNPKIAGEIIASIRENSEATMLQQAISDALKFQNEQQTTDAIKRWRDVANIAESVDIELASRAWFSVGYLYEMSDNAEQALSAYEHAIRLRPNYAHAFKHMGIVKIALDRYEEAIMDHNNAINIRPGYYEAYAYRGHAKHYLYQFDQAMTDFNVAIRLEPSYEIAYMYRGHTKSHLSQYEDAILDYDIAIELNPILAESYSGRGGSKD